MKYRKWVYRRFGTVVVQMLEVAEVQEAGRPIRCRRAPRTEWVSSWLTEQQRIWHSQYYALMPKLENEDPHAFKHLTHLPTGLKHHILERMA